MICEETLKIDIRKFGQSPPVGLLRPLGTEIEITSTPCHFGGRRYWFVCPICRRRCAILYPFICRICAKGRYRVELETVQDRRITRAIRLRRRLGQKRGGTTVPIPPKPKWMRWHTYFRLRSQVQDIEHLMWREEAKKLRRMGVLV